MVLGFWIHRLGAQAGYGSGRMLSFHRLRGDCLDKGETVESSVHGIEGKPHFDGFT